MMRHKNPAATHHAIPRVRTDNAAPHSAMEMLFHLAMVAQRVRSVPRGTQHSSRLMRQGAHRHSRRHLSAMGRLLGDAVYSAASNGRNRLQERTGNRPAMEASCDFPDPSCQMGRYPRHCFGDMGQRFPGHRGQRLGGNRQ